jgi:hypothetical protein
MLANTESKFKIDGDKIFHCFREFWLGKKCKTVRLYELSSLQAKIMLAYLTEYSVICFFPRRARRLNYSLKWLL